MSKFTFEYTDTYGGEANYCWVRRVEVDLDNPSNLSLVRRAKREFGLNGVRTRRVDNFGDMIALWFDTTVLFITLNY